MSEGYKGPVVDVRRVYRPLVDVSRVHGPLVDVRRIQGAGS